MKVMLIPSSKLIEKDLQNTFGKIPSVLTPMGKETILDELYKRNKSNFDQIIIIAKEKIDLIKEYVKVKRYNIEVIELDKVKDLGYSISYSLSKIKSINLIEEIFINFGDTLAEYNETKEKNVFYYDEVLDSERWTVFKENGNQLDIYDKNNLDAEKFNAFIGIFKISEVLKFYELLLQENSKDDSIDSFYRAIKKYCETVEYKLKRIDKWLDLGHKDNYDTSKKDVKCRYFNTIDIDRRKGILTKTSEDKEKFKNEILWYLKLPNSIKYLSPRIFDYSVEYNNMRVKMEYYGYSTIHEMFVYGDFNKKQWKQVYESIFMANYDMRNFTQVSEKQNIRNTLKSMYLDKTIDRLNKLREDKNFKQFFLNNIIINEKQYNSLQFYMDNLEKILENNNIYNLEILSIIHGDLCFSNILYDLDTSIIRLIDPRGKFGEYDIYGDFRYDLAKLSHSVNGKYDFIINDLFDISIEENNINLNIQITQNSKISEMVFNNYLDEKLKKEVRLIESLLFLSMIPLHKDYPTRQLAMMCIGIELISRYI